MKLKSATAMVVTSFMLLAGSLSLAQQQPLRPGPPGAGPRPFRPIPVGQRPTGAAANPPPGAGNPPAAAGTGAAPAVPTAPGTRPAPGTGLPQNIVDVAPGNALHPFEGGVEPVPFPAGARILFNLQDAELPDLIRAIGNITGKRFILGSKIRAVKTTIYSPTKVTPGEAYQAFLSILDTNGLTAVPAGRYIRIEEAAGAVGRAIPMSTDSEGSSGDERYVTRIHRLRNMAADEAATLLGHFKSHDGDVTAYPATNTVIITDTGPNIRRMMQMLEEIDVPSVGVQIWVERIHYASASDLAQRINDLLGGASSGGGGAHAPAAGGAAPAATSSDTRLARLLPDDRSNSLIIAATERMYLRVLDLIRALDVPVEGEGEVHVYYLQHADSDELSTTLNAITGGARAATPGAPAPAAAASAGAGGGRVPGVFEGAIRITADKRTNALVITSTPRDYASIRHVIGELDRARRQVFIEAVVMELGTSGTTKLGVSWHGGSPTPPDGSVALGGFRAANSIGFPGSLASDQDSLQGLAVGVRGPALAGTTNLIPGLSLGIPEFGAVLNAVANSGDGDVLATPSIIATDNSPADINVGENIALQQNLGGGISSLAGAAGSAVPGLGGLGLGLGGFAPPRQDVGTKIRVTPHINDSNEIRLEIDEEISEAGDPAGALGVIPINKRTAKTTLVVQDQQTVVIGGLIRNAVRRGTTRIPILGDIPLLGILFRTETRTVERRNLLLFLTPYVIRDQSDLRRIFERKMRERQEFLDRYFVFSESQDYHPLIDYSRTNGMIEEIRQSIRELRVTAEIEGRSVPRPPPPHTVSEPIELPVEIRSSPGTIPTGAGPPVSGRGADMGPAPPGSLPIALPANAPQLPAAAMPVAMPPGGAPPPGAPGP